MDKLILQSFRAAATAQRPMFQETSVKGSSYKDSMKRQSEGNNPGESPAAIDLAIENGRVNAVRLYSDFLIHPEARSAAVRKALAEVLNGLPIDLEPAALAARLRAAIPFGVELAGTSPAAIAASVRRAIDRIHSEARPVQRIGTFTEAEIERFTDPWKTLPWRLLPERTLSPHLNVALDEVLSSNAIAGAAPSLRFWRWSSPAVVVGRCQSIANEVDLDAAKEMNMQIVRRMTGGGAMFVQPDGAITYSLILPESALAGLSLRQSYEVCDAWVIRCLRSLGIDAHHVPINDIACGEGKIGGAAQSRRGGIVLHHTTLAYAMEAGQMAKVLRIGRVRLSERAVSSASKRVSPLSHQTKLSREAIVAHLFDAFQADFGGSRAELTETELRDAEALVAAKYAHPEWTHQFD